MNRHIWAVIISIIIPVSAMAQGYVVSSPDGNTAITVEGTRSTLTWAVSHQGESILLPSEIGLSIEGVAQDMRVKKASKPTLVSQTLTAAVPVKYREVKDVCNEMSLTLRNGLVLKVRAYDNGAAYRFESRIKGSIRVLDEVSDWNFAGDRNVYWPSEKSPEFLSHCEGNFKEMKVSAVPQDTYAYLPVSISDGKSLRTVVTEAGLCDYPNMFLFPTGTASLKARYPRVIEEFSMKNDRDILVDRKADWIAKTSGTRAFPWRIMTIGDDCSTLENTLPWQLGEAQVEGDFSWVRPGRISWEWWNDIAIYGVDFRKGINTQTYKYFVDFASKYGLEYILLDEGWSASTLDVKHAAPELDINELIAYAKSKNVGVVLWSLWNPLWDDMAGILDLYEQWGVAGIKVDFLQHQDQNMVNFYETVAKECAKRHLLVDYHGAFKPSGLQRKYPNVMTFEGVYGMEQDKWCTDITPDHDLVLPFTRMVAGPMDYTPGATINATQDAFVPRWSHPMSQGTRAHQAAIFIAYESPLQMLCDSPSNYLREPEFTGFLAQIPTTWDEIRAIEAKAGDYLLLARRHGDAWFVSAMTDWTARDFSLDLSAILGEGKYDAQIFCDGIHADLWAEDYSLVRKQVDASTILPIHMAPGGGYAAILTPAK